MVVEVVDEVVVVEEMVKAAIDDGGGRDGRWSGRWWLVIDGGCKSGGK